MTAKLSSREHSVLCAITDWKAPFEVIKLLFPSGNCSTRDRDATVRTLKVLCRRKLAEYGKPNGTYKITEEGRAALAGKAAPRDIPVIFSAPMILALLAGRKSMTRRLAWRYRTHPLEASGFVYTHPLGPSPWQKVKPGDLLYARENFSGPHSLENVKPSKWPAGVPIWYWADDNPSEGDWTKPRPSIFLPRWASRLTLEVTSVKIERLKDINDEDAKAEGIMFTDFGTYIPPGTASIDGGQSFHPFKPRQYPGWHAGDAKSPEQCCEDPAAAFWSLWSDLHGQESFAANPELVCLSFHVHQQNIDAFKAEREAA